MNMTTVLRYIEANLGYRFRDLEIDDNEIMDSIHNTTLPVFSSYFPCTYRRILTPGDRVPGYSNRYYLDSTDPNEQYRILGVKQIYLQDINNLGFDQNAILGSGYGVGWGTILRDSKRMPLNPVLFEYFPPNQVDIRPTAYVNTFLTEIKVVHPDHLATIHPGMEEDFKNLALYDVMNYLYNIRNRFTELNTPFGTINLNLDHLSQGMDRRNELLEKFRANMNRGAGRKKIWIY